jgi:hypothetical protein
VCVVHAHFGSDPRRLSTFGIEVVHRAPRRTRAPKRVEREVVRTTIIEQPGRSRVPEVEVIETDETVETTEAPRRERRKSRAAMANSAGTPNPGATPMPSITPPASSTKVATTASKKKSGKS